MADCWNFLLLENVPSPSFATSSKCPAFLSIKNKISSILPPSTFKRSKLLVRLAGSEKLRQWYSVLWFWCPGLGSVLVVPRSLGVAGQSSPSVGRVQPRSFDFGFVRSWASSILQISLRSRVYPPHANKRSSIQFREDEDALKDN